MHHMFGRRRATEARPDSHWSHKLGLRRHGHVGTPFDRHRLSSASAIVFLKAIELILEPQMIISLLIIVDVIIAIVIGICCWEAWVDVLGNGNMFFSLPLLATGDVCLLEWSIFI